MIALIISIGDELLSGHITNTNATFIAEKLNSVGIETKQILAIGDDETEILTSINQHFDNYNFIIVTGGLGPTHDDITKAALCKYFESTLVVNDEVKRNIERVLSTRKLNWTKAADEQCLVPNNCKIIPNKNGTAAGMIFEKNGKYLISMPGVPYEMQAMMEDHVLPFLKNLSKSKTILQKTLRTTGIPEAYLTELLGDINEITKTGKLAFLPSPYGVNLHITAFGENEISASQQLDNFEKQIISKAQEYIYSVNDEEMEYVIGKLLLEKNLTLSVAESCTGGLICSRITNVSGSSKYFERGVVTYSNKSKIDILNVPEQLMINYGAVSKEVAEAMAAGIRKISNTDIGISTTGIAGPTGGTNEKPVGLVWIGYSDKMETFAEKFYFGEERKRIKIRASQAALDLLRKKILQTN